MTSGGSGTVGGWGAASDASSLQRPSAFSRRDVRLREGSLRFSFFGRGMRAARQRSRVALPFRADLLYDGDGALADERDGHRLGADAVARDAAGGVGGT
jgi:hypothetical protein